MAPLDYCSGNCVDKKTDMNNCGSCGVACTGGQVCNNGLCQCTGGVCGSCGVIDLGNVSPQSTSGSTAGGTDVIMPSCAFQSPEVVYQFTAPVDGNYKFDTTGSSYEVAIALYTTACTEISCKEAFFGIQNSMNMTAGQTIYIVIDGYFDQGSYVLNISNGPIIPCPELTVGALPATISGDNTGSSDNMTGSCASPGGLEDTYSFTAPVAGTYAFDTFGTPFDTILFVLNGSCNGAELGCNDDTVDLQSQVILPLAASQTVVVVVDGYDSTYFGPYTLHVTQM